jgi:hypothetical protein
LPYKGCGPFLYKVTTHVARHVMQSRWMRNINV